MAYYSEVMDLRRPSPHVLMIHFELRDDATDPESVLMTGTLGFNVFQRDGNGDIIAEALTEKRARLKATYDSYIQRLIDAAEQVDQHFEALRSQAVGYRYPAGA